MGGLPIQRCVIALKVVDPPKDSSSPSYCGLNVSNVIHYHTHDATCLNPCVLNHRCAQDEHHGWILFSRVESTLSAIMHSNAFGKHLRIYISFTVVEEWGTRSLCFFTRGLHEDLNQGLLSLLEMMKNRRRE